MNNIGSYRQSIYSVETARDTNIKIVHGQRRVHSWCLYGNVNYEKREIKVKL